MARVRLALVRSSAGGADDAGLAERLAAGDRDALTEAYERFAPEIFGVLVRLLSRSGEAEDVLQETFVALFQKAGQIRDKGALRAWLFRVAIREAHARLKRRRRWSFFADASEENDDATLVDFAPGAAGDTRAELALLDRELAKLPPEQRIAWMLRYVEGESLEDVADACGCSLATAKRWVASADQAVRRHVRIEEASDG